MNDPKYGIVDGKLYHRQGKYSVPEEEPVMVLRGKDPQAIAAIEAFIAIADESHKESATERLIAFKEYQERYPERTKIGCHNHI